MLRMLPGKSPCQNLKGPGGGIENQYGSRHPDLQPRTKTKCWKIGHFSRRPWVDAVTCEWHPRSPFRYSLSDFGFRPFLGHFRVTLQVACLAFIALRAR